MCLFSDQINIWRNIFNGQSINIEKYTQGKCSNKIVFKDI